MIDFVTQRQFLLMFSSQLERFKEKSANLWNCRCPFCGDSTKKASKARGYFFVDDGSILYKCHNCGVAISLISFIKQYDNGLYRSMMIEHFKNTAEPEQNVDDILRDTTEQTAKRLNDPLLGYKTIQPTGFYHDYLKSRFIPDDKLNKFIEIPSMKEFASKLDEYKEHDIPDVRCIGIPFYVNGKLTYFQCRNLESDHFRYMTFKVNDGLKLFGFDDIDPSQTVSVLEGPFDSVFVNNAIANAGAADNSNFQAMVDMGVDLRFIPDKDYETNQQVRKILEKKIKEGFSVVIYDGQFRSKDINSNIEDGFFDVVSMNEYLDSRTFKGIRAKLELSKLSR